LGFQTSARRTARSTAGERIARAKPLLQLFFAEQVNVRMKTDGWSAALPLSGSLGWLFRAGSALGGTCSVHDAVLPVFDEKIMTHSLAASCEGERLVILFLWN